jgi:hypothetical protein
VAPLNSIRLYAGTEITGRLTWRLGVLMNGKPALRAQPRGHMLPQVFKAKPWLLVHICLIPQYFRRTVKDRYDHPDADGIALVERACDGHAREELFEPRHGTIPS